VLTPAGALHLHPVSKILQFRTSLHYLDDLDARARSAKLTREEEDKADKAAKALAVQDRLLAQRRGKEGGKVRLRS
jgi:hypothetical protein